LGTDAPNDAELITKYLGQKTIMRESATISGGMHEALLSNQSHNISEAGRSLMTSDEVMRMHYEFNLLLLGGNKPYLAKKIFYWKHPVFKHRASMEPAFETYAEQRRELFDSLDSGWMKLPILVPNGSDNGAVPDAIGSRRGADAYVTERGGVAPGVDQRGAGINNPVRSGTSVYGQDSQNLRTGNAVFGSGAAPAVRPVKLQTEPSESKPAPPVPESSQPVAQGNPLKTADRRAIVKRYFAEDIV
jgi:hypothetical protein